MITTLLKQSLRILKESPYLSFISILGTALAIGLIMTHLIADRAMKMNLEPEIHRERTLYVKWVGVKDKVSGNRKSQGYMSLRTIKECFQSLQVPEAVTVTAPLETRLASIPGGGQQKKCYALFTDVVFWKVYTFKFLAGVPYTKGEFDAGTKKVVISEQLARTLFNGVSQAVGKQLQLNYITYTVCGVVGNVSSLTNETYAQAWLPYTAAFSGEPSDTEGITGKYKCQILARSSGDFDAIRNEINNQVKRYNAGLVDIQIDFFGQPDTKFVESKRFGPGYPDMWSTYVQKIVTILVILLVPAINLSGFTLSRMRKRKVELGVRKAFGATKWNLIGKILSENMVYSLLGGVFGLVFSYLLLLFIKGTFGLTSSTYWGMDVPVDIPLGVFINPGNFLLVFFFCLALNLLSACIPAWRASSLPIVESLKED